MDRQVSNSVSELDLDKLTPILQGHLTDLPPISSRLVRIFISSTFSDMVTERNALMEYLYPQLKEFCRSNYGLEFQLIDLRWGIRAESQEDHTTIDFCLREIDNCRRTSIGSSFVAFLGQKYGYRPFPPNILSSEFVLLKNALVDAGYDVSLLNVWYREDHNVAPSVYRLQPISSIIHNYNCKGNIDEFEYAQQQWLRVFKQLQQLLRVAVSICIRHQLLTDEEKDKYFVSVTEYEIDRGMQNDTDCKKNCLGFIRIVDDINENLDHAKAGLYTDIIPGTNMLDTEAQDLLYYLRDIKLPKQLPTDTNLDRLHVTWNELMESNTPQNSTNPPSPNMNRAMQSYIKRFCSSFYDRVTALITSAMCDIENLASDTFVVEVLQHLFMCRSRCETFKGRSDLIERVQGYIQGDSNLPLVVYGESGCGKTSVLAKVASLVPIWMPSSDCSQPVLILRFLGTTARSSSIRLVLASVCWHICLMYGLDITDIPSEYPDIVTHFHELLKNATPKKPLLILLDSLDQLSATHQAHQLSWLPNRIPPNVRLIVSTLPYEYNLLNILQEKIPECDTTYIQVLPLGQQICLEMINDWLNAAHCRLTPSQQDTVAQAMSQCSLPLYTKLVFEEVCRWHSYDLPETAKLEFTVKGVINKLLDRIERKHGLTFVTHALSYLTASSTGLSDAEIEDILSLDDCVLNDVYIHWIPPVRRIPPLLWPRLMDELSSYIVEREANGILVFYWYHRQFIAVSRQRYLSEQNHRIRTHSVLADYYLGTWGGGRAKPVEGTDASADRKVPLQPLHFKGVRMRRPPKSSGLSEARFYNLRKLVMLPYHLTKAGRVNDLKREVLFNYTWLHTKLAATSLQDILSDFRVATESGTVDEEIQLLANTLRVGGSYVNSNPATLAFDLVGRLLPFYDQYENVRSLLRQCDGLGVRDSALIPVFQCFESPRGMLMYILEEHTQCVLDLSFSRSTNELITVSKDGTIAFWDLKSGERTRTVDVSALQPGIRTKLEQNSNGHYLVCDSDAVNSPVWVLEQRTGILLHSCSERKNTHRRCDVEQNLLLRQNEIIDLQTGKLKQTVDSFQKTDKYATVALTHNEKFILVAEGKATYMYSLETKVPMASFPGDTIASKLVVTPDDRRLYAGYAVSCLFKVFDIDLHSDGFGRCIFLFNYQKAFPNQQFLTGTPYGRELAEISMSAMDQNKVLLNIKHCHLVVCHVVTGQATIMENVVKSEIAGDDNNKSPINNNSSWKEVFFFGSTFSADGRYTVAGHSHYLYVWASLTGQHLSTITIHSVFKFPFAVSTCGNLVATGSNIHTAIKVWDLDRLRRGTETTQFRIYENPVNLATCSADKRVLFVKQYYPLNSGRSYHYVDCFGIDAWNLSTGNSIQYLPFGQYGRLIQMQTSRDLTFLALLLCNRTDTYVMIIDLNENIVHAVFQHENCKSFVMSEDNRFLVTMSSPMHSTGSISTDTDTTISSRQVCLWSIVGKARIQQIKDAHSAVFSYDNLYMMCLQHEDVLLVISLIDFTQMPHILWPMDRIQVVPCTPNVVMVSSFTISNNNSVSSNESDSENEAVMWNFVDHVIEGRLSGISPQGVASFSKNGSLCIDFLLQVYELPSGQKKTTLRTHRGHNKPENAEDTEGFSFVHLTYDGRYAVWTEELSIKVCRLSDEKIIGNMSTHEKPTTVQVFDYGYMLVVGREDGHILTMKLIDPDVMPKWTDIHKNTAWTEPSRTDAVLSHYQCTPEDTETFEYCYRNIPDPLKDSELPQASARLCQRFAKKAKVPHAIILTETTIDDPSVSPPENVNQNDTGHLVCEQTNSKLRRRHSEGAHRSRSNSGVRCRRQRSVRGSLHEIFSPVKIIRSTSGLFNKQSSNC